jgi:hypothetical protein
MFKKTKPLGFRKWLELENLKSKFVEAAEKSDFPEKVYAYLSAALDVPAGKLQKNGWENTVLSLMKSVSDYPLKQIPLLKDAPKEKNEEDWTYEGRTWFYYAHLISNAYGWTLDYIANLDPNEALAHLQEIMTSEFLQKEFAYGLSEVAYPYNPSTKKSEYKAMSRPYWMRLKKKEVKKTRMKRNLLPIGVGVDVSGLPKEYGAEAIISTRNS